MLKNKDIFTQIFLFSLLDWLLLSLSSYVAKEETKGGKFEITKTKMKDNKNKDSQRDK